MITTIRSGKPSVRSRSLLDRLLGLFTHVESGEGVGALLLAANIFTLLASYYLLKTARESLILSEGSAEVKSYAAAFQALILVGAVPVYGLVATRVNRSRLINGVLLFFVSHLAVFAGLASHGYHIGVAFFLWVGIFNLMIVAQFWSFANDLYNIETGRRLFPLVGVGGSIGAWLGARAGATLMADHGQPADLFGLAAIGLLVCVGLNWISMRAGGFTSTRVRGGDEDGPLGPAGGVALTLFDPYLRLIAVLVILVNLVITIGEYLLGRFVVSEAMRMLGNGAAHGLTKAQLIGMFYGDFFAWVNLAGLAIQLVVVSRVFKWIGVGGALFVLPLIALGSYGLFAFVPLLGAVRIGKIFENATDYSLQNTTRHALFLPTSREAKFKAKQAIDGLCWRLGDLLQAGVVFLGTRLAFGIREFALLNEVFVCLWIGLVVRIYREHGRRTIVFEEDRKVA